MTGSPEVDSAVHRLMDRYMLFLDSYDEKEKTYWLVSDDMPLMSVTEMPDNVVSLRMIIENVTDKAKKAGMSPFDFYMKMAAALGFYSVELEMDRYTVYSCTVHDLDRLPEAAAECMDVYRCYANIQKTVYPFL